MVSAPMNTTLNRLNSVTALATSTLFVLVSIIAFLSYPLPSYKPNPSTIVNIHTLDVIRGKAQWHMDRRPQDYLQLTFDVNADLGQLFNWNTKQIFVQLVAEYGSKKHAQNSVVFWDRIIRRKEDAKINIIDETNKYGLKEVSGSFGNITSATFSLRWNVMPHVGILSFADEARTGSVTIPPLRPRKIDPVEEDEEEEVQARVKGRRKQQSADYEQLWY